MDMFFLTLQQLMMMITLIFVGFILRRKKIVPEDTGSALARLENYVFAPALTFINQLNNCNVETFINNSKLILYGLVFVSVAIAVACPLSALFVRNSKQSTELAYKRNIYKYALTFSNHGFMGNFIILGVFGDAMLYKYLMFTFIIGAVCSAWGLYILIPKGQANIIQNLKQALLAPPILALFIGAICGLLNLKPYFPEFLLSAMDNASVCMGPVAMLLAGIVIGGYDVKEILSDKKVYIATFLRLIVIPSVFLIILKLLGTEKEIMTLALIAYACPLGLNTIVYPAAYGGETKTGASMTLVSHALSVITIPLMYYLFIVLL